MLTNAGVRPTIPVINLERAKNFYGSKLGLKPVTDSNIVVMPNTAVFDCGNGTSIELYQRNATKADHTIATFEVKDIENEVKNLKSNGVVFEEYDLPELKTKNGIAEQGSIKCAWFKDTEGNILCVHETTR